MNTHEMSHPSDPTEAAIEEFLEGETRAEQWRVLREALQARLRDAAAARDALAENDPGRASLEEKVAELREQVTALATEEAVTRFVEDSVRASLTRPARPGAFLDGIDDDEFAIDGY